MDLTFQKRSFLRGVAGSWRPSTARVSRTLSHNPGAVQRLSGGSETLSGMTTPRHDLLGYARVSTDRQDLAAQVTALQEAGCARVWKEQVSTRATHRPELIDLMTHLRPGDTLVSTRLDRPGRSVPHLLQLVADLDARGANLRCLHQPVDTSTPTGRLTFVILAAVAEFERDLIRERTLEGLAQAAAEGRRGGRPPVITPARIRAAKRMRAEDPPEPIDGIASMLGVSRASVYRMLAEADTTAEPAT